MTRMHLLYFGSFKDGRFEKTLAGIGGDGPVVYGWCVPGEQGYPRFFDATDFFWLVPKPLHPNPEHLGRERDTHDR
jgi:hypothetical protein